MATDVRSAESTTGRSIWGRLGRWRSPEYRAAERKAWRTFGAAMGALGVAFLLAVYSDVLAREGNVWGVAIAGSVALLISGFVGVTWVPRLARRTSIEWLRTSIDYHLTREGMVYISVIFILSIAALNTGNNMLFLILAAMIAAILVSGFASRMVLSGAEVEIVLPDHVFARQPVLARVKLRNTKPVLPSFSVRVGNPEESQSRRTRKSKAAVTSPATPCSPILAKGIYFPYVRAGREVNQVLEVVFPRRGAYRDEFFALSTRFPFGFLEKIRKIPAAREMVVYPSVEPTEEFYEILPMLTGEIESYYRGRGHDLYSIRDYLPSDSARFVDWKASAHTAALKVREFTREDERRLQLIFDRALAERTPKALDGFERAVDLCAALAWHFEQIDAQFQFISDDFQTRPGKGEIFYEILRYLAFVEAAGQGVSLASLGGEENVFKIILTAVPRGSIPTSLWASSYFIFYQEL